MPDIFLFLEITDRRVIYLDLVVDIWIAPDGTTRVLDEDELGVCRRNGLISPYETDWIEAQKKIILKDYNQIISQATAMEKTSGFLNML